MTVDKRIIGPVLVAVGCLILVFVATAWAFTGHPYRAAVAMIVAVVLACTTVLIVFWHARRR